MRTIRIELPWPHKHLSPNARVHWAAKAGAAKKARMDAFVLGLEANLRALNAQAAGIVTTFHPPTAGRYDTDNLLARCKAYFDGIADAMKVDDSHFDHGKPIRGEVRKGGAVVVEITAIEKIEGWEQIGDAAARAIGAIPARMKGAA